MTDRKLPTPFYAAAGAGEILVEELKKLPGKVEELRDRSKVEQRAQAVNTAVRDNVRQGLETLKGFDPDKVRAAANETAETLSAKAREAGVKARETYADLVVRGQHVANGERSPIKVIATIAQKAEQKAPSVDVNVDVTPADMPKKPAVKKTVSKPAKKTTAKAKAAK
jgi:heparin binding hemagglutinin HbhA